MYNIQSFNNVPYASYITITPDTVSPQETGGNTEAGVTIQTSSGTNFTATIYAVPFSGGHQHAPNRPAGVWKEQDTAPKNVYTGTTDSAGRADLTYVSGAAGGEERIEVVTGNGKRGQRFIFVRLVGLVPLPRDSSKYKWNSGDGNHPNYLYAKPEFITQIAQIAEVYKSTTGAYLSFNDLSLISGGIFDAGSTWSPPHNAHRKGTSADVNRNTNTIDKALVPIDKPKLDGVIKALNSENKINCCRLEETTIHIECPKPADLNQCTISTQGEP